jgi:hypothetical protein
LIFNLDCSEFGVFDLVDCTPGPAAKRLSVTVNFTKGIVSSRLGACQHPVEPFERINLDGVDGPRSPASMCHNVVVGERHN